MHTLTFINQPLLSFIRHRIADGTRSVCVWGGANIYMYIINIYLDDDKIGLVEQSIRLLSCSKCF